MVHFHQYERFATYALFALEILFRLNGVFWFRLKTLNSRGW